MQKAVLMKSDDICKLEYLEKKKLTTALTVLEPNHENYSYTFTVSKSNVTLYKHARYNLIRS